MLSQFAFETFERGDYLFKKATVEQHIVRYIRSLPGAREDEDILHLDEEAVLKSITAQHGLLVARASGIYSFSHLTFHEYFAAQHIVSHTTTLNHTLQNLATHITERRYREIFLLTAEMLPEADTLLLLMKQQIDLLMQDDPKIQMVLSWTQEKADSVNTAYKPAAIRAFYYAFALTFVLDLDLARVLDRALPFVLTLARALDIVLDIALKLDIALYLKLDDALEYALVLDHALVLDRALDRALDHALVLDHALILDPALDCDPAHAFVLNQALAHEDDLVLALALALAEQSAASNPELQLKIQALRAELPNRDDEKALIQWWFTNGTNWAERLRTVMIEHRNIGHDWQFSEAQKEKLCQYYDANKLLVDCLNSGCRVTQTTRQYIEDTLLLPLIEIAKYPVPDAIATLYPNKPEIAQ
ncbi:hypothetical protein [Phormidium sp. FACHB-1136]|uniref:NACHT domain-containing protein n=1 Tax=Phormidium sp. FACHB-1136 TaxID=2692848 RepID=UPI00168925D6|nr:hypothetical protein [Phormidium sp. FACHB-1136]MBD2429168.1 hypothetical protein [Phormidium sp. FACHB-1136]